MRKGTWRFRDLSFGSKLSFLMTLTTCVALVVASLAFLAYRAISLRSETAQNLSAIGSIVAANSTAALAFGDAQAAREILTSLRAQSGVVSAAIYSSDGAIFAVYRRGGAPEEALPPPPQAAQVRFENGHIVYFERIVLEGDDLGTLYIKSDLHEMSLLLKRYAFIAGLVLLASIVAALALSSWMQRIVSGPVMRLAEAARAVSEDRNYSIRVERRSGDELGLLTTAFNEMLSQIETTDSALRLAQTELETRVEERTAQFLKEARDRQEAQEALRRSEEQLRQAQKLEAIGRLAGGVAHDFNNILTVILGYGELAVARLDHRDPLRQNIEEIAKAGERAASLTRQLLAFSRKQVLAPKTLDLNEVVADIDQMLRRLIGEDVELVTAPGTRLASVNADPGQIEQVVMNLAVNARDAMPPGGKLTIETANMTLDGRTPSTTCRCRPAPT